MNISHFKHHEDACIQSACVLAGLVIFLHGTALFCAQMLNHALTPDWPWLYRAGSYIVEQGRLPTTDLFSWTYPDQAWVLYQWLFEVASAQAYDLFGQSDTVALFTILSIVIYASIPAILLRRRGVPAVLTFAVAGLVLPAVGINFGLRPMIATSLFLLIQFEVIRRWCSGSLGLRATSLFIASIYLLWANMHLGIVLGFLSLLLFATGDIIDAIAHRKANSAARTAAACRRVGAAYALLFATGFCASLLNPYGVKIYFYIANLSLKHDINAQIRELMSPDMGDPYLILAGCLAIVFLLTLYSARVRVRYRSYAVLHLLVFMLLTAFSARFIVWAGLFYVLIVPQGLWHCIKSCPRQLAVIRAGLQYVRRADGVLISALTLAVLALAGRIAPLSASAQVTGCVDLRGAINYMQAHYPRDTRWLSDDVGGSCALWYAPDRPVFADTRFDMYPEAFVRSWLATVNGQADWRQFLERWHIKLVLTPTDHPLSKKLADSPDFTRVYKDKTAYLFARIR